MTEQQPQSNVTTITFGLIVAWGWSIIAMLSAVGLFARGLAGSATIILLSGVLVFPPLQTALRKKGVKLSAPLKVIGVIVLVAMAGYYAPMERAGESGQAPSRVGEDNSTAAPQPAPATKQYEKKVLLDIKGTGDKSTETFTTQSNEWDLAYSYNCSNSLINEGNFIVEVLAADGNSSGIPGLNLIGHKGEDVNHYHQGGTFYIEIVSQCRWHIIVGG